MNNFFASFSVLIFSLIVFSKANLPTASRAAGLPQTENSSGRAPASNIENRIKVIVAGQLRVQLSDVKAAYRFTEDLGGDDLDQKEIIIALEDEFKIDIADEHAERILTVQQAIDYIEFYIR